MNDHSELDFLYDVIMEHLKQNAERELGSVKKQKDERDRKQRTSGTVDTLIGDI